MPGRIASLVPIVVSAGRRKPSAYTASKARIVVAESDQRRGADRDRVRTQREAFATSAPLRIPPETIS
jgi:hypothetical protein